MSADADTRRAVVRHLLVTIAHRGRVVLGDAPDGFGQFVPPGGVRPPLEILAHMVDVLQMARHRLAGEPVPKRQRGAWADEVARFHADLMAIDAGIVDDSLPVSRSGADAVDGVDPLSFEQLLHGPLSDVLTHVGQLAMLRRMAGSPVTPPGRYSTANLQPGDLAPA